MYCTQRFYSLHEILNIMLLGKVRSNAVTREEAPFPNKYLVAGNPLEPDRQPAYWKLMRFSCSATAGDRIWIGQSAGLRAKVKHYARVSTTERVWVRE